ncbi:hypothetical protein EZV73_15125 [Acidaminobacter sp. JC074]|uniref:DUF5301 domain-containing protein n=1 Tax=Acidaminobacter sp. JC074 TaxID=2530199 RepID=UPI001F105AF7|nr:DUF5301 domain-containing protein [Acidaminobacter sp. JC074]MCH4888926.1 hypothetical protein [Acidaminobacter sp. JC074]
MEKKKLKITIVIVVFVIYMLYNNFLPKAESIEIPDVETINYIQVKYNETIKTIRDKNEVNTFTQVLLKAKPTRTLTTHDLPVGVGSDYYSVRFSTDHDRDYRSYIYMRNNVWYVEQPYVGIYKLDKSILDFLDN